EADALPHGQQLKRLRRPMSRVGQGAVMARWSRRQRESGSWSRRKSRAFGTLHAGVDLPEYAPWTITPSLLADRHSSTGWMIVSWAIAAAAVVGFAVWLARFN